MKTSHFLLCLLLVSSANNVFSEPDIAALKTIAKDYEAATIPDLIDRQAFITEAAISTVLLSPDGHYVAYLARENHHTAVHLLDVTSGQKSRLFSTTTLNAVYWTSDSGRLILDLETAIGVLDLTRPDKPEYVAMLDSTRDERFLGSSQHVLDQVLIVGRNEDNTYTLEQVDSNGARRQLLHQDTLITNAVAAQDGSVVIVDSATAHGHEFSLLSNGRQEILFSCVLLETCRILSYQRATNTLWLESNSGSDLINLMAYSLTERNLDVRHTHAEGSVDLSAALLVEDQPLVVQYNDGVRTNDGLDEPTETLLQEVQHLLPDSTFTPQISSNRSIWLISESSALLQYPRQHLFDTATSTLTEILQEERNSVDVLPPAALSARLPLQYPARDGSILHGYVSLPKGRPLDATGMITLPHGGPLGRIDSSYNEFTQFLVNRGYIVFEPNFRVSTGYGRAYVERAAGEFGDGVVQQDIVDGVLHLTEQGIGDPQQLAIAGHSFGGFAVLSGLAFTPELFKAGFASAAPADMASIMQFQRTPERTKNMDPSQTAMTNLLFGASDDTIAMQGMSARAPLARFSEINAPLILIAGGNDTQVPINHVKDYALALLNQQKTVTLFLDESEGHGIGYTSKRSKLAYMWMAEEFFATYIGGRTQALEDPALASYIRQKILIDANPEFSVPVAN
ncbi:MAG: prolyl oligopeptidase family serine peptidase [Pseudomonadota bacterium]